MSDKSWDLIKNTVEDVIALINTNAEKLDSDAKSVELAKLIFNEIEKRVKENRFKDVKKKVRLKQRKMF